MSADISSLIAHYSDAHSHCLTAVEVICPPCSTSRSKSSMGLSSEIKLGLWFALVTELSMVLSPSASMSECSVSEPSVAESSSSTFLTVDFFWSTGFLAGDADLLVPFFPWVEVCLWVA